MSVTFRQLEVFVAVASTGSISKAAHQLRISQVAVSRHISSLESACGKALFDRSTGKAARLNEKGDHFLTEALGILSKSEVLGFKTRNREKEQASFNIRVGADPVIFNSLFLPASLSLEFQGSPIVIEYEQANFTESIENYMKSKKLDLYYITYPVNQAAHDFGELIAEHKSALYISPDLFQSWLNNPNTLLTVLLPPVGSPVGEEIKNHLAKSKINNYQFETRIAPQGFLEVIQQGVGVGIMAHHRVEHAIKSGALIEMPENIFEPCRMGRYLFRSETRSVAASIVERTLSKLIVDLAQ